MKAALASLLLVTLGALSLTACETMDSAEGISQNAGEVTGPDLGGTSCDDDAECAGLLEPGGCYVAVCDDTVGACAAIPMPNGTPCSDTSGCGVVEGTCDGGQCVAETSSDCDDGDPCTEDICTTEFGCVYKDIEDCQEAKPCGDGACSDEETCESCPQDCGPCDEPSTCGDGTCDSLEVVTCPEDCETPRGDSCGDGECSGDESAESCPEDCGEQPEPPDTGELLECLSSACGGEFLACLSDPVCAESLECIGACGSDTGCLQGCVDLGGSFSPAQIGLVQCAAGSGCLDLDGGGGPGGGPQCGDGECEDGESADSCPEDCGGDQFGCGDGECEVWEQWTCPQDCEEPNEPECGNGQCEEGETPENCAEDCDGGGGEFGCGDGQCEVWEQWTCPEDCEEPSEPECGNGECEEGETPESCAEDCSGGGEFGCGDGQCEVWEQWTCPEDCEEPNEPECGNGECEEGETADSCPNDCGEVSPECGNGKCEAGEDAESCPEDCENAPPVEDTKQCLMDQCELGACLNYPVCTENFECMASCPDSGCAEACIADLSGPAKNVLSGVLECGTDVGCWEDGAPPEPSPGLTECLQASCEEQLDVCLADDACWAAYPCLEECVDAGEVGCTNACMPEGGNDALLALGQCGGQAGCGNNQND